MLYLIILANGESLSTGWNYSRLGPVLIQKELSSANGYSYGENLDSIVVVSDDGCVNPQMKVRTYKNSSSTL